MNSVIEIAKKHGRKYITPEDITEALENDCPETKIQLDVLQVLGNITGYGAEDKSLCAFVAWKGNST